MSLFKIALYIRVSTEEQAENPEGSIKNQEERLREFVKLKSIVGPFGEIKEVFTDAGISAKDMNRPALQKLLRKIETREINLVLVTELSRFTRSIKDFSILWEFLEKYDCKFLSIKDNFDTSTAAGEMVMYMMANVAQFERKQTAERISHSFLARAKRGLYNGGTLPLGYEVDTLKPGSLAIVPEEAEVVREVFKVFLKEETLAKTAKKLNEKEIKFPRMPRGGGKPRTGIFRLDMVHTILKNKAYIGIRVFEGQDGKEEAKAVWEPIIESEIFNKAQKMLEKNRYRKRSHLDQRYPFTLSGICYCKTCGDRMSGKSAHGRTKKIPYYEHAWATKHQAALSKRINQCDPHRIQASKIEPMVWQEVKRFLSNEEVTQNLLAIAESMRPENTAKIDQEKVAKKVAAINDQMEALAERIARLPKGIDDRVFMDQMRKLQDAKSVAEILLTEIQNKPQAEDVVAYRDFIKFTKGWREMLTKADSRPEIQAEIVRKIVHRVEVTTKGFEIEFYVGKEKIMRELGLNPGSRVLLNAPNGVVAQEGKVRPSVGLPGFRPPSPPLPRFLKDGGSKRLTNGGPDWSVGAQTEIIDFIPLSKPPVITVAPEMARLYGFGYSLAEIAKKLNKAKSTVKRTLEIHGVVLRPATGSHEHRKLGQSERKSAHPPFGFVLLRNKFVPHPNELEVLREIHRLMRRGLGPRQIANELNKLKLQTRKKKPWAHSVVTGILKRLQANQYPYNEVKL